MSRPSWQRHQVAGSWGMGCRQIAILPYHRDIWQLARLGLKIFHWWLIMADDLKVPRRNNRMISLLTQTFSKFVFLRHFRSIETKRKSSHLLMSDLRPFNHISTQNMSTNCIRKALELVEVACHFIRYSCPYCLFFLLQLVLTLQNALVAADWSQRNFKVPLLDITGQRDYWRAVLTVLPNHRWPGNFCKALFVWRTHLNIQWLTCLPYMGSVVPISCFMLILVVIIV